MKLIIDIATTRKEGKLHLDNRVLTFCDEFKALPETEALALLATIQNDLAIIVKRGESILTKKAGLN
jgi:hypothetical protein